MRKLSISTFLIASIALSAAQASANTKVKTEGKLIYWESSKIVSTSCPDGFKCPPPPKNLPLETGNLWIYGAPAQAMFDRMTDAGVQYPAAKDLDAKLKKADDFANKGDIDTSDFEARHGRNITCWGYPKMRSNGKVIRDRHGKLLIEPICDIHVSDVTTGAVGAPNHDR